MEDAKGRETLLKAAWIDDEGHIVSFHEIKDVRCFIAPESEFWEYIANLVNAGYSVQ